MPDKWRLVQGQSKTAGRHSLDGSGKAWPRQVEKRAGLTLLFGNHEMSAETMKWPIQRSKEAHAGRCWIIHHSAGACPFETKVHEPDAGWHLSGHMANFVDMRISCKCRPIF